MAVIDGILFGFMREQLHITSLEFKRYAYDQIDWSLRMLGLVGPRGIGKSTLIKQRIIIEKERQ